jgi:large subunit ribosomal protein L18
LKYIGDQEPNRGAFRPPEPYNGKGFASSLEKDMRTSLKTGADISAAKLVGKLVAARAAAAGVKDVVFDRGSYLYHGRVKALADVAREGGLNF